MQRNIFFLLLILLVLAQRLPAQKNKVDGTYMRKWLILGPFFPQDLEHDFLADYGGETNIRPEAGDIVETKDGRQLTWISYESPSFRVNFIAAVGRYDAATIYAFSYIDVDRDDNTRMLIGKDDGMATWINGKKVYLNPRISPPFLDIDSFEVNLKSGLNPCLVKVFNGFGDWAFAMKGYPADRAEIRGMVIDETGTPVPLAAVRVEQNQERIVQVQTDESGQYFASVFPVGGTYNISAREGLKGNWILDFPLKPRSRLSQSIRIQKAVSIGGQVLMLDGETPHQNVIVQLVKEKSATIESGSIVAATRTNRLGKFQFINVPVGKYYLRYHTLDGLVYYQDSESGTEIVEVSERGTAKDLTFSLPNFKRGLWQNFGRLDGLVGSVNHIFRDQANSLWFGTSEGLARYDGKGFSYLSVEDGLVGNNVSHIAQTNDKKLWIGTTEGLSIYDGREFKNFNTENGLLDNRIRTIFPEPDNSVWFTMGEYGINSGGLARYDGKNFAFLTQNQGLSLNSLDAIHKDPDGEMWLGTLGMGFASYQDGNFTLFSEPSGYPNMFVFQIFRDSKDILWIHSSSYGPEISLSRFDGQSFVHYGVKDGLSSPLSTDLPAYLDSDDTIWLGHGGAYRFDGNSFVLYTEDDGLVSNNVRSIMRDSDGSIWFGTGNGISRYIEKTFTNFSQKDGLPSEVVGSILGMPDGSIWFDKTHYSDGRFTSLKGVPGQRVAQRDRSGGIWFLGGGATLYNDGNFINLREEQGLVASGVSDLIQTRDGIVWMGTDNGVSTYDGRTIKNYGAREGVTDGLIRTVCEASDNSLWFGGTSEIVGGKGELFHYHQSKFTKFTTEDGLIDGNVNVIFEAKDNNLYVGTTKGLSVYDGKEFINISEKDGLLCRYVNDIYQDAEGIFWFAGQGISSFDGTVWSSLDVRDGIAGESINAIHQDKSGNFWLATNRGVTRYIRNKAKPVVRVAAITTDQQYTDLAQLPSILTDQRVTFEVVTTDFNTVSEKQQYRYKIPEIEDKWSKTNNLNTFDYTFSAPGNYTLQVQYIDRDLNYSDLAEAKLTVVVPWYLSGAFIFPSGFGLLVLISISVVSGYRYQLKRREAQQLRDQMLEQERQNNEALTESYEYLKQAQDQLVQTEKMASLGALTAGIAHEIRNPLNFVNNFAELSSELTQELLEELEDQKEKLDSDSVEEIEDILDNLGQNLSKIDEHGRRADSIVNGMLLHSRGVSGERSATDLNALLEEYVNLAYHGLRAQDTSFNITIERDYDESLEQISVVPQDISRVFLNILNNACYAAHQRAQTAKEGFAPTLWVRTKGVSDQVQIGIKDNGTGIPEEILNKIFEPFMTTKPTGSGTGLGLSISYEIIVDEHQGKIDVDTQEGEYTEFIITLPKNSEPESD